MINKKTIITLFFILLFFSFSSKIFSQFQSGKSMMQARMSHYQVTLDDGNIWVVGGHGIEFKALNTAELYDIKNENYTLQNMNFFHDNGALVKMKDGKFLIAGGAEDLGIAPGYNTAEIYDPVNKSFTVTGSMTYNRTNCSGTLLSSGKVLIAGGWYNNNSTTYTEIYDPNTSTFISAPSLVVPRANPMVLPTNDGGAVVFGGYDGFNGNPYYQSVEYYDAVADSFKILSDKILPGDEGYYIAAIKTTNDAIKSKDGKYILGVYRQTDSVKEYVFLSFDPELKIFSSIYRETVPDENPFYLVGSVLDQTNNIFYSIWQLPTTPIKIGLGYLDLATNNMTMPEQWFELPENYYPGYSGISLLNDNTILMTGGFSSPGANTNFSPIDSTIIIKLTTTGIKYDKQVNNKFELSQNYPNPFNPTTTIKYSIKLSLLAKGRAGVGSYVSLKIYDILGKEIKTLVNEEQKPGVYKVQFDASNYSNGIYYCRLVSASYHKTIKMTLLK